MKSAPKNVPLVDTPAAEKMFEGHTWGWDDIDLPAVVAQNQNEPSLPFLHQYITTLSPYKMVYNCFYPINFQVYEGVRYCYVDTRRHTTIFRSMYFNIHLFWMEEGRFLECQPL